eukprot:s5153_g6.t2
MIGRLPSSGSGVAFWPDQDVCATDADGVSHVLTDGLAGVESRMVPLLGLHHKTCREITFPMNILERGLSINILEATASHQLDRTDGRQGEPPEDYG